MDYESNFGNIKKILRLPNLLGASEVLPAYLVSKKGQNILHGIRAAPAAAFPQLLFYAGACTVRRRHCLCRCAAVVIFAACVIRNPKSRKCNF
jgi:hypothetical protein